MLKRKKHQPKRSPKEIEVPDGTAIEANGLYFYVRGGKKQQIISTRILLSQSYPRVIPVTVKTANSIPNAPGRIGFREGSVVQDISDKAVYLISNNQRRKVVSPDFYEQFEVTTDQIIVAAHEEILLHKGGEDIGRL